MELPTTLERGPFAPVLLATYSTTDKFTEDQIRERLGDQAPAPTVLPSQGLHDILIRLVLAGLLHMQVRDRKWHWGITAQCRRLVRAVGKAGVTEQIIATEYHNGILHRPRVQW